MLNLSLEQLDLNDDWQHAYQKINRNLRKIYENQINNSKNGMNLNSKAIVDIVETDIDYDLVAQKVLPRILNAEHPIGSFLFLNSNAHPSEDLHYPGTWQKLGEHTFLTQAGANELGDTIGSNEITITDTDQLPEHSHEYTKPPNVTDSHAITTAQMPSHNHGFKGGSHTWGWGATARSYGANVYIYNSNAIAGTIPENFTATYQNVWNSSENAGSGQGHTHGITTSTDDTSLVGKEDPDSIPVLPKSLAINIWQRIS